MITKALRRTFALVSRTSPDEFAAHQTHVSKASDRFTFMNDMMSFGLQRLWKKEMARMLGELYVGKPLKFLDLCSGTGDMACRVIDKMRADLKPLYLKEVPYQTSMVDCNPDMIRVCKARVIAEDYPFHNITEAAAEDLPFESNTFDAVLCSFGFRSIVDKEQALHETYRVLRPGGRLLTLEFGKVENPVLNFLYAAYKRAVIPAMGQFYENNYESYEHLANTVDSFYSAQEWASALTEVGFSLVSYKEETAGVVMIHSGVKLT